MSDRALCGWRVASAIALPELPVWHGGGAVDIRIVIGAVPAALGRTVLATPAIQLSMDDGRVLLHVAGVGRYLVDRGRHVTVAPIVPRDAPELRLYLLGAVFGYLCHQRGLLPAHAAAIELDGRAILFAGRSGAGKSTLAAAFCRRGYRLLSDDLSPIVLSGETALVLPGLRRIRLCRDSAAAMDWPDGLEQCDGDTGKVSRAVDRDMAGPLPAAAILYLGSGADVALVRLRGVAAIEALGVQVYRRRAFAAMLGDGPAMQRVAMTAARIPRHYRFDRPRDYAALDMQIDRIVAAIRAG